MCGCTILSFVLNMFSTSVRKRLTNVLYKSHRWINSVSTDKQDILTKLLRAWIRMCVPRTGSVSFPKKTTQPPTECCAITVKDQRELI